MGAWCPRLQSRGVPIGSVPAFLVLALFAGSVIYCSSAKIHKQKLDKRRTMGKVIVTNVELQNNEDVVYAKRGYLEADKIRSKSLDMIADTGARAVGLPMSIIESLGLPQTREVIVTLSSGKREKRPLFGELRLRIGDRESVFDCMGKPEGAPYLLGQLVFESLDLVVDCPNHRVTPNPEAPDGLMLYEDF